MSKRNVSKTIPNGTIVHTRDEYFFGSKDYRKPGYDKKGNYRRAVVVDTTKDDQMVVVKLITGEEKENPGIKIKGFRDDSSYYKPFAEVYDDDGRSIKIGYKFINRGEKMPKKLVTKIKKKTFKRSGNAKSNRSKVRRLKGRE